MLLTVLMRYTVRITIDSDESDLQSRFLVPSAEAVREVVKGEIGDLARDFVIAKDYGLVVDVGVYQNSIK